MAVSGNVKRWAWILIPILLFCGGVWLITKNRTPPPGPQAPKPKPSVFIDYEVLRQWIPGRSGIGLELLVSPTAKRIEVMQLANHLINQSRGNGQVVIFIFDSREAWANRDNDTYPEKEYFKHFLVTVMSPPLPGESEVRWTAKGRTDPTAEK
jgi:hypothetical protein